MPYTPDYTDTGNPTDTGVAAATAAAEFRNVKVGLATKVPTNGALGTPTSGNIANCTGLVTGGVAASATDVVMGRSAVGAGPFQELACTAAGRALLDDANAAAQRTTLGLGNVDNTSDATKNSAVATLTNKTLLDFAETPYTVVDAPGVALSPTNGTIQTWTLGASRTPTAGTWANGQGMTMMIADGTAYAVTWTGIGVTWVTGVAPSLPTTGYGVIELWKTGNVIYGAAVGNVA